MGFAERLFIGFSIDGGGAGTKKVLGLLLIAVFFVSAANFAGAVIVTKPTAGADQGLVPEKILMNYDGQTSGVSPGEDSRRAEVDAQILENIANGKGSETIVLPPKPESAKAPDTVNAPTPAQGTQPVQGTGTGTPMTTTMPAGSSGQTATVQEPSPAGTGQPATGTDSGVAAATPVTTGQPAGTAQLAPTEDNKTGVAAPAQGSTSATVAQQQGQAGAPAPAPVPSGGAVPSAAQQPALAPSVFSAGNGSLTLSLSSLDAITIGDSIILVATVSANGGSTRSVQASITLPTGLTTSDSPTQEIGELSAGQSSSKSWRIQGNVADAYTITVTATGDNINAQTSHTSTLAVNSPGIITVTEQARPATSPLASGGITKLSLLFSNTGGSAATVAATVTPSSGLTTVGGNPSTSFGLKAGQSISQTWAFLMGSNNSQTVSVAISSTANNPDDFSYSITGQGAAQGSGSTPPATQPTAPVGSTLPQKAPSVTTGQNPPNVLLPSMFIPQITDLPGVTILDMYAIRVCRGNPPLLKSCVLWQVLFPATIR